MLSDFVHVWIDVTALGYEAESC